MRRGGMVAAPGRGRVEVGDGGGGVMVAEGEIGGEGGEGVGGGGFEGCGAGPHAANSNGYRPFRAFAKKRNKVR